MGSVLRVLQASGSVRNATLYLAGQLGSGPQICDFRVAMVRHIQFSPLIFGYSTGADAFPSLVRDLAVKR